MTALSTAAPGSTSAAPVLTGGNSADAGISAATPLGSNAFYWYNLGIFAGQGLAVPNWGLNPTTLNGPIAALVLKVGHNLQNVMLRPDAWQATPPSLNTVSDMVRLINRFRQIVNGRTVAEGIGRLQLMPGNATPSPTTFTVFPTPYFTCVNQWMAEYAQLMLLMLTDAMQSGENAKPLEITEPFAQLVSQYVNRANTLIATDLLQIPVPSPQTAVGPGQPTADPTDPAFVITQTMLNAYAPSKWFTPTELTAVSPQPQTILTKASLGPLTSGLLTTNLPNLPFWGGTPSATPSTSSASTSGQPVAVPSTPA